MTRKLSLQPPKPVFYTYRWMEVQAGDASVENPVILDELSHVKIEDFNASVFLGDGDEIAVSMPAQLVAKSLLVLERVNKLARFDVEDFQRFVLGT